MEGKNSSSFIGAEAELTGALALCFLLLEGGLESNGPLLRFLGVDNDGMAKSGGKESKLAGVCLFSCLDFCLCLGFSFCVFHVQQRKLELGIVAI